MINNYNKYNFYIVDFDLFHEKFKKNEYFSDNAGFLGYKVNISFRAEKLPYFQICGTKVGTADKNGVLSLGLYYRHTQIIDKERIITHDLMECGD